MRNISLVLILAGAVAMAQTSSRDFLNEGVKAFKAARYPQAIEFFQQAASTSPADSVPHLYLGTAYLTQFIPGADTPDNDRLRENAEREFQAVLGLQPDNLLAMNSLARLHYMDAQGRANPTEKVRLLDQAAQLYQKIVSAHPGNKEACYSLGVIAWTKSYPERMQVRQKLGMRPEDPGPLSDVALRADLRSRMGSTVDEGIRSLERALSIDPGYDDAMAYLNLLYRDRADLSDSPAEYQRDVAVADSWVKRALDMKRSKRQEQQVQALPGAPAPGTMRFKPQQLQDGQVHGGVIAGIIAAVPSLPPPPPPPPSAEPVEQSYASKQIRIAGNLQSSRLIEKPEPEYPALARQARIQGTVRFNATITKDGTVGNLSLVSGHPLLVTAATEAVRRYRYEPTLLNGEPVEVLTQIDVSFTLGPQ